jgi:hypothetical protein
VVTQCRERLNLLVLYFIELVQSPDFDSSIIATAYQGVAGFRHENNLINPVSVVIEITN